MWPIIGQRTFLIRATEKPLVIPLPHSRVSSLTEDEHQNRHSGQTGQTYGKRHRLADNSQSAKDEVTDAVRLEVGVFQLKHDRAVGCHTEIRSLRVALFRCFRTAGAKPARFVA